MTPRARTAAASQLARCAHEAGRGVARGRIDSDRFVGFLMSYVHSILFQLSSSTRACVRRARIGAVPSCTGRCVCDAWVHLGSMELIGGTIFAHTSALPLDWGVATERTPLSPTGSLQTKR